MSLKVIPHLQSFLCAIFRICGVLRSHLLLQSFLFYLYIAQHWTRARLEYSRYLRMISGFRQLQLLAHDWLNRRHAAAIVIQSVVRTWSERQHLTHMHHSAVIIQVVISRSFFTQSVCSIIRNSAMLNAAYVIDV